VITFELALMTHLVIEKTSAGSMNFAKQVMGKDATAIKGHRKSRCCSAAKKSENW
jgi:hypothetical protein